MIFSAQVKHHGNLPPMAQQRDRWVHEDPAIQEAKRVFQDPLRIRASVMPMRINLFIKKAHQGRHNQLMGK